MIKVESEILNKLGKRENWREIAFFASDDETQFEVREYYGQQKISYMKETARLPFDCLGIARMNYSNMLRTRVIDGYEPIEQLKTKVPCLPFSNFKPPMYKCDFDVPFAEQLSKINDPVVIPVQQGKRAYIKLGQESINSIQAVDIKGNAFTLDKNIQEMLASKVAIGSFESGVLETYILDDGSVCLYDVIMLNGTEINSSYKGRQKSLKGMFGHKSGFTYPDTLEANTDLKSHPGRHFIVKDNSVSCLDSRTFVIPNFYSVKVLIEEKYSYRPGYYKVMFTTPEGYESIGDLYHPHEELYANTQIQIAFKKVENGKPVNFWFSPIQHKNKLNYDEDGTDIYQMAQLSEFWHGC